MYTLFEASELTAPLPVGGFAVGPTNASVLNIDQKNTPINMTLAAIAKIWTLLSDEGFFIWILNGAWRCCQYYTLIRSYDEMPDGTCGRIAARAAIEGEVPDLQSLELDRLCFSFRDRSVELIARQREAIACVNSGQLKVHRVPCFTITVLGENAPPSILILKLR